MFGNQTGHKASPQGGKLQALASIFGNLTTIVTSLMILGAVLYFIGPSWMPAFPPVPPGPGNVDAGKNPDVPVNVGKVQELNTEKQALAFARTKQRQAANLGDEAIHLLNECLDEVQQFDKLWPNPSGQRGGQASRSPAIRRF